MLNFILLFTTLFSVRAMSDMEAKLQRRVEVLEATVKLLLERDAQREAAISADFAPRRLAEIKPIDRKGVTIKSDKAWLTMGKDSDFKIVYTGDKTATVMGNLEISGDLKSDALKTLKEKTNACVTVTQMNAAIRATQTCAIRKLSSNHPDSDKGSETPCVNGLESVHACFDHCRKGKSCKGFWFYDNGRCCPKAQYSDKFTKKIPGGGFYDFDCGPTTAIPYGIESVVGKKNVAPKGSYIQEFHGKVWFLYLQNGKGSNFKNTLRFGKNSNGYGSTTITQRTGGFKIAEAEFDKRQITTVMAVTDDDEYVIISYKDGSAIKASDAFAARGPSKQVILKDWKGKGSGATKLFGPATTDKHGPFFHDNWGKGYGWMWTDHSGVNDNRMGSIGLSKASQSHNHGWRWFAQF